MRPGPGNPVVAYGYPEERVRLIANTVEPLVPAPLEKYELRTRILDHKPPEGAFKIASSREVVLMMDQVGRPPGSVAVLAVNNKGIPVSVVGIDVNTDDPSNEDMQNILAAVILTGAIAFIVVVYPRLTMASHQDGIHIGERISPLGSVASVCGIRMLDVVVMGGEPDYVSLMDNGVLSATRT